MPSEYCQSEARFPGRMKVPIPASNDAQTANTGALRALRLLVGKREIGKNQYSETSKLSFRKFSGSYLKINRDLVAGG